MNINRTIPDFSRIGIAKFLFREHEVSEPNYCKLIEEYEKECEQKLVEVFERLAIFTTIKTDRYLLPYKSEIVNVINGISYYGAFDFRIVMRGIVKQVLEKNISRFRFYVFVNLQEGGSFNKGQVEYRFRYYHNLIQ